MDTAKFESFTEENTLHRSGGGRACRTCNTTRKIAWKLGISLEEYNNILKDVTCR